MTLRQKLVLGVLALSVLIGAGSGSAYYFLVSELQLQAFLDSRLSLARAIAANLDGDRLSRWLGPEALHDPEYQRVLAALSRIRQADPTITYLYTIFP